MPEQTFHTLPVIPDKNTVKDAFSSITNSGNSSFETHSHEHNNAKDDSIRKAQENLEPGVDGKAKPEHHAANPGPVQPKEEMMGAFEKKASSEELKKRAEELNK